MAERFGAMELQNVRRQTIGWQKTLSEELSQGHIKNAVQILQKNQAITWNETKEESLTSLLQEWTKNANSPGVRQILAQRNVDVDALNEGAREILRSQGKLGDVESPVPPSGAR